MRYSKAFMPTVKEVPSDAEVASHKLMIRAGLMRRLSSGTYTYLPAGWKILQKIMNIVREEMNRCGAQEILLPSVQPMELWQQSGRDVDYGETMCRFKDRHGRWNVLAPTAEEVVTNLVAGELNSYKQLPFNIYQISFKFRDEFRPRFGVLRSREFIMKDAYSFHDTPESLDEGYQIMYEAYKRVFIRCGVPFVIVLAESGEMGGSGSHQFTVPCESGEDLIVHTEDGDFAANIEKAPVDPIKAEPSGEPVEQIQEVHTPGVGTIADVCDFLKTSPEKMIKTLIYTTAEGKSAAVLLRGDHEANEEKITQQLGGIQNELAQPEKIKEITGADVGFAGPAGIEDKVDIMIIDQAVSVMAAGITGANKTDYHLKNVVPGRDFPLKGEKIAVTDVRNAVEGDTWQGKKLLFKRGIEVGQVFKLGSKYCRKLGCNFLDVNGKEQTPLMGCYGIGINRILASAIETGNDDNGIIWPVSIAPYEVIIVPVGKEEENAASEDIYNKLTQAGIDCLLDDRNARGGVKFNDADLLGIPLRITVGRKSLAENKVEVKLRRESDAVKVEVSEIIEYTVKAIDSLKSELSV
ncbi:Proline--tRNA ligase [Limihaloglobus sulfuriphilus]|uniref:Proline--tRNA ligase n=1 Tax=Limihaloglobus sulfuriphilus TaxID=1851148 RepID=A0A1Q2MBR9_9BACT|nr:proline--tRNA ligase [Limihaloglobus sulfuriphilus]AQQ70109.1 Proline--tRNA ligase [Limihaloglobus sulfuriphilus]